MLQLDLAELSHFIRHTLHIFGSLFLIKFSYFDSILLYIYNSNILNLQSNIYQHCKIYFQWSIWKKKGYLLHHIGIWRIIIIVLVMVEVVLSLGPPTSPPIKFILAETGMMGGLFHIRALHRVQYGFIIE